MTSAMASQFPTAPPCEKRRKEKEGGVIAPTHGVCVCECLTSGFAWPVRPRDAGPGADHRTGRVGLPIYIHKVLLLYMWYHRIPVPMVP